VTTKKVFLLEHWYKNVSFLEGVSQKVALTLPNVKNKVYLKIWLVIIKHKIIS